MPSRSKLSGSRKYVYFPHDREGEQQQQKQQGISDLPKDVVDKLLKTTGREALREKTPNLQELEQALQGAVQSMSEGREGDQQQKKGSQSGTKEEAGDDMPLVRKLMQKGYLKDSPKWLSGKGFVSIGGKILDAIEPCP